ncbi:hypothetical protein K438DRAFT_1784405 [Mycena galopus ATCC 62051]|nr:hypothetical protein K438DRAFT_1784405 [Mycena galopus ATCC 62051]
MSALSGAALLPIRLCAGSRLVLCQQICVGGGIHNGHFTYGIFVSCHSLAGSGVQREWEQPSHYVPRFFSSYHHLNPLINSDLCSYLDCAKGIITARLSALIGTTWTPLGPPKDQPSLRHRRILRLHTCYHHSMLLILAIAGETKVTVQSLVWFHFRQCTCETDCHDHSKKLKLQSKLWCGFISGSVQAKQAVSDGGRRKNNLKFLGFNRQ